MLFLVAHTHPRTLTRDILVNAVNAAVILPIVQPLSTFGYIVSKEMKDIK